MKILILVRSLTAGGEQRVASLWTKGFVKRGHDLALVLGCSKKLPISFTVPSSVRIYNVYSTIAHYFYRFFGIKCYYLKKLRNTINEFNPDVIISLYHPWTEWAKISIGNKTIPIVSTEHTTFERPDPAKMSTKTFRDKYICNLQYDFVTVLTTADKKCLEGHLDRVMVMPNPLTFMPAKQIPPKDNIILAVGQLHSWHIKGFDILINAWGRICKQHPDWKLQIAGGDRNDSNSFLKSIADKYDVGKQIVFLGFVDDMLPIYQRSSIFVLSSRYEGFGMALTEAMSQGCACIACDYKGRQSEIIGDNSNGIICPTGNIDALVEALHKMLNNRADRLLYQKSAIERSKYYYLDSIMNKWDELFSQIFQSCHSG